MIKVIVVLVVFLAVANATSMLHRMKSQVKFADSEDFPGRLGVEEEIKHSHIVSLVTNVNKDPVQGKTKAKNPFGLVTYHQTVASTKKKIGPKFSNSKKEQLPILDITVDGVDYTISKDFEEDLKKLYPSRAREIELGKDKFGNTGLMEVITGPATFKDLPLVLRALKIFYDELFSGVTDNCKKYKTKDKAVRLVKTTDGTKETQRYYLQLKEVINSYNKIVKEDAVLKTIVTIVKKGTGPKKKETKEYDFFIAEESSKTSRDYLETPDGYGIYVACLKSGNQDTLESGVQINYACPLSKFGKPLADTLMYKKEKKELLLAIDTAIEGFIAKDTILKDINDKDVQGLFNLLVYTGFVNAWFEYYVGTIGKQFSDVMKASREKNLFDQHPKANYGDLIRMMKQGTREKLFKWWTTFGKSKGVTTFVKLFENDIKDEVKIFTIFADKENAEIIPKFAEAKKKETTPPATSFATHFQSELLKLFNIFYPTICKDRFTNEDRTKYGDGYSDSVTAENEPLCLTGSGKYLPAGKDSSNNVVLVMEARATFHTFTDLFKPEKYTSLAKLDEAPKKQSWKTLEKFLQTS